MFYIWVVFWLIDAHQSDNRTLFDFKNIGKMYWQCFKIFIQIKNIFWKENQLRSQLQRPRATQVWAKSSMWLVRLKFAPPPLGVALGHGLLGDYKRWENRLDPGSFAALWVETVELSAAGVRHIPQHPANLSFAVCKNLSSRLSSFADGQAGFPGVLNQNLSRNVRQSHEEKHAIYWKKKHVSPVQCMCICHWTPRGPMKRDMGKVAFQLSADRLSS